MRALSPAADETPTRLRDILAGIREPGVFQVGFLVTDFDEALGLYAALWGVDEWRCFTYGPETVPQLSYRGRPARYSMRVALAGTAPQLELIAPLTGPSIYEEWLTKRGPGLHHVAFNVASLSDAITAMSEAGYEVIQSGTGYGLDGDGGYAYFDTEPRLGVVVEALEVPQRRRPPERVWRISA